MIEFLKQLEGMTFNLGDDYPLSQNIAGAKEYLWAASRYTMQPRIVTELQF